MQVSPFRYLRRKHITEQVEFERFRPRPHQTTMAAWRHIDNTFTSALLVWVNKIPRLWNVNSSTCVCSAHSTGEPKMSTRQQSESQCLCFADKYLVHDWSSICVGCPFSVGKHHLHWLHEDDEPSVGCTSSLIEMLMLGSRLHEAIMSILSSRWNKSLVSSRMLCDTSWEQKFRLSLFFFPSTNLFGVSPAH